MKKWLMMMLLIPLISWAEQPAQQIEEVMTQSGQKISIINLGDQRFKIGNILLDKNARSFELPGKFLRTQPPIEFLAVAKNGKRGYESFLEFDVNVYEFNVACILIGLDTHKGLPPKAHFDPAPVVGDAVDIVLSWEFQGKKYEHSASEFFLVKDQALKSGDWVYTGSTFIPQQGYLAEVSGGTLVGFVHDPASIIEHGQGFGSQSYGELKLNQPLMPSIDTPLKATFKYVGNTQK